MQSILKPLILFEDDELLVCDKPVGISTHSPGDDKFGFVEYLQQSLNIPLWLVHRLDKETSGLLLLTKSQNAAKKWAELFNSRKIKKTYFALTKKTGIKEISIRSSIQKQDGRWHSLIDSDQPNSETHFTLEQEGSEYDLWRVTPVTGKTHQIRLHALDAFSSPLVGDTLYGATKDARLCLHAHSLEWENFKVISPLPNSISRQQKLQFPREWEVEIEKRISLFDFLNNSQECLRVLSQPKLRADKFGEALWVYDYDNRYEDEAFTRQIEALSTRLKCKHWCIQYMQDRGDQPTERNLKTSDDFPSHWFADENGLHFEFRKEQGLSPGLFLDQRENRLWVRNHSKGKSILNLFAYTAGFSLNAALGNARDVVTVDLSKNFIEWSKRNFEINQVPLDNNYEFWAADSFYYLQGAKKRQRHFDLIICDPPSFSRSKAGVFKIKKDLPKLIQLMREVLSPGGAILLSTNFEQWDSQSFDQYLKSLKLNLKIEKLPLIGPDVFIDGQSLLKAVLLRRD